MWKIRGNVDVVKFDIVRGVDEYFFPESVDFRDKKINNITVVFGREENEREPNGNGYLIDNVEAPNFYLDLYDEDGNIITQNLSVSKLNPYSPTPLSVNKKISLKLSCLRYMGEQTGTILIYVSYSDKDAETNELPLNSINLSIPIEVEETKKLSDFISDYFVQSGKKIKAIASYSTFPFYLDITTFNGKVFRNIHKDLIAFPESSETRIQPFLVDDLDIDFRNSTISNNTNTVMTIDLTFYY
jgi:hypothetical protein